MKLFKLTAIILILAFGVFRPAYSIVQVDNFVEISVRASSDSSSDSISAGQSSGADARVVTLAVVLLVMFVAAIYTMNRQNAEKPKTEFVVQYMKKNHTFLVRDILQARGPMLTGWAAENNLSPRQLEQFRQRLDGSQEQIRMLEALNGEINDEKAEQFAMALGSVLFNVIDAQEMYTRYLQNNNSLLLNY